MIGAGTVDLTLQSIDDASLAFFDSGYQEFNLNPPDPEPFGVVMGQDYNGGCLSCLQKPRNQRGKERLVVDICSYLLRLEPRIHGSGLRGWGPLL